MHVEGAGALPTQLVASSVFELSLASGQYECFPEIKVEM